MHKVYLFFIYVPEDECQNYPVVNRYQFLEPQHVVSYGNLRRCLYAYTDRKLYRDLFMQERNMKLFGHHPTTVKFETEEEYERFDQMFMGRELEFRGVRNHKFVVQQGIGNVLGTSDEFSYVQYDYPNLLQPTAEDYLPCAKLFLAEFQQALVSLRYPFETIFDFLDGYGWFGLDDYDIILDEYAMFIKYFSNLYKVPKKGVV